jgi:hypothetical protein
MSGLHPLTEESNMQTANEIREALATARNQVSDAVERVESAKLALQRQRGKVRQLDHDLGVAIRREEKLAVNRDRAAAKRIAKKYSITIEDDSAWDYDGYDMRHWVCLPQWLEGEDPLEDGHFSYDWSDTRWLVEFYAKHHPSHPEHDKREFLQCSPWN